MMMMVVMVDVVGVDSVSAFKSTELLLVINKHSRM